MGAFMQIADSIVSPFSGYVYPNETVLPWGVSDRHLSVHHGTRRGRLHCVESLPHVSHGQLQAGRASGSALGACVSVLRARRPAVAPRASGTRARGDLDRALDLGVCGLCVCCGFLRNPAGPRDLVRLSCRHRRDVDRPPRGSRGRFYRLLTLGSTDVSEAALSYDRKWTKVLAAVGIGAAAGLHGYVGFVFGSLEIARMVVVGSHADHLHSLGRCLRRGGAGARLRRVLESAQDRDRRALYERIGAGAVGVSDRDHRHRNARVCRDVLSAYRGHRNDQAADRGPDQHRNRDPGLSSRCCRSWSSRCCSRARWVARP